MDETFSDLDSAIQLSKDKDTLGFDLRAGTTWIYPTNYPLREYQFSITQAALHNNTLVSLPTGLGKTFIAAVIMYNYYRWYPMGKIIFMAPTKPLVAQQLDACYNIMAIPSNVTAEITGLKINTSRAKIWQDKRVFFITPHILQNDIETVLDLAPQIKCIIVDEAHRALGKNANCEAIRKIQERNSNFRILALSATPGSNFTSVKDVISNLLISHIEVRSNESVDVAPYVFQRKLDTVVIPIKGKLLAVKNDYIKVLDVYTRPLLQYNIFTGNCANLTKGRIVLTMKDFKEKNRQHPQYGFILRNLNICITLYHGYELLIRHGLRGFLVFFDGNINPLVNSIRELHAVLDDVRNYIGPFQNIEMLPDGTIPEVEGEMVYSHPKFQKLSAILLDHFKSVEDTRVMVFCEYRESVMEIYAMLLRNRPIVKPRIFLGKGATMSQAQQLQAVRMFKAGTCNTLVSTCIGEEGLDVGEVDLIVCFDISSKSPIRMVQRMGRTGRKRDGRVVVLVTEGKEQQLLDASMAQKNSMNNLLESQPIKNCLYKFNPPMIPRNIKPECNKMHITVLQPEAMKKKKDNKKPAKKNTIKNMFENLSSSQSSNTSKSSRTSKSSVAATRSSPQKRKAALIDKQGDIRSMFSKISSQVSTIFNEPKVDEQSNKDVDLKSLIAGIKSYLNINTNLSNICRVCDGLFDCKLVCYTRKNEESGEWSPPDNSIFDRLTSDKFKSFTDSIQNNANTLDKSNHSLTKTQKNNQDNLEISLEYLMLDSIVDIFSDDSSDGNIDSCTENPVLFNQSLGIFKTLTSNEPFDRPVTPMQDLEDIVVSDSDNSPVLSSNRAAGFKNKVHRKLFSQSPNTTLRNQPEFVTSIVADFNVTDFETQQNESKLQTKFEQNIISKPKNQPTDLTSIVEDLNVTDFETQQIESNIQNNINKGETIKFERTPKKTSRLKRNNSSNIKQPKITSFIKNLNVTDLKTIDSNAQITNENNLRLLRNDTHTSIASDLNCSSTTKSHVGDVESPKTESLNKSVLETSLEDDFDIWDASIFENDIKDDSDSSINTTENVLINTEQMQHNNIPTESVITTDLNSALTNENPEIDIHNDSDETIILSFNTNDIFGEHNKSTLEDESNALNKSDNSDCVLLSFDTNEIFEDIKITSPTQIDQKLNKSLNASTVLSNSVCNKSTVSLLSITQIIDSLDNSKSPKTKALEKTRNCSISVTNTVKTKFAKIIPNKHEKDSKNKQNSRYLDDYLYDDLIFSSSFTENNCTNTKENQTKTPKSANEIEVLNSANKIIYDSANQSNIPTNNLESDFLNDIVLSSSSKENTFRNNSQSTTKMQASNFKLNIHKKTQNKFSKEIITQPKFIFDKSTRQIENQHKQIIHISDDSEEERSLLSYSQNTQRNKHKKLKLSLVKNPVVNKELHSESLLTTQSSPIKPPNKKILNLRKPIVLSESEEDDDFQVKSTWVKPVKKLNVVTPKKIFQRTKSMPTSKHSLVSTQNSKGGLQSQPSRGAHLLKLLDIKKKKEQRNKLALNFIDAEAEIEDDEHYVSDDDENSDNDLLESSFINDTQSVLDHTDMQAKYLQSVKSPKFSTFKIPKKPPVIENIYSQEFIEQDDTYMNDSFCVGSDITLSQRNTMTYLEHAEAQLEEWGGEKKTKKRKRILQMTQDDSD